MRILVISLAGIGDTLFATPLIQELRANFADATIDALVMWNGAKDVLEGNPFLNNILQKNLIAASRMEGIRYLAGLRKHHYDVSLNTHPQSKLEYRVAARLINARLRISHRYHHSAGLDRLFVNRSVPQDYSLHSVENNLQLLPLAGAQARSRSHRYQLYLSPQEQQFAADFVDHNELAGRVLFGIHVGSGGTKNLALRRWPLAHYAELIRKLLQFENLSILLFGGPDEAADNDWLVTEIASPQLLFPRTTNLRQAAALVGNCQAFLSVDTALMHVAAAMRVPRQFVIETPTWNRAIEPYRDDFTLIPNPRVGGRNLDYYRYDGRGIRGTEAEIKECMKSVTVNAVFDAVASAVSPASNR